ncbi:MAG: hypothetical protein GXX90_07135 [Microbacteriaceae bacterium]|nr:hypothetical protein [Microbacteriaceae bacterium]
MTRPAALLAIVADAVLCVVLGIGLPLLVATIGWLATAGWQTGPWSAGVDAASALWALGLGGGVGLTIEPEALPQLQLAQPFAFVVSIAPLGLTALVVAMGWRAGARVADDPLPWAGLGAGVLAFGAAAWASLQFAAAPGLRIDAPGALIAGVLTWAAALAIGARIHEHVPWPRLLGRRVDTVLEHVDRAVRLGIALVVGALGLGALLVLVTVLAGPGRVVGLMEALQLDVWGVIAVALVQLLYAPTLVVWATAWVLGPGVALGVGSLAHPGGTDAGPLPIVPLLGLVPESLPPLWWGVLALPVALAALLALALRGRDPDADAGEWWERLIAPLGGAAIAALVLGLLAHLSRGALGPGRLVDFGPHPGWVMLAALGLLGAGAVAGAWLPLEAVPLLAASSRERDEDADGDAEAAADADARADDDRARGWVAGLLARVLDPQDPEDRREDAPHDRDARRRAARRDESDPDADERPRLADTIDLDEARAERRRERGAGASECGTGASERSARDAADRDGRRGRDGARADRDLGEVLRRPGEPDIYADLDDDL